jgi:hypothetical protein
MSQFRFTCRNSYAERYTEVQVEAETLDDVIVNFEEFLRGCGYYFDGTLQLISDDMPDDHGDCGCDHAHNANHEFVAPQATGWHREWVPDTENAWGDDTDVPVIHVQDTEGGVE